MRWILRNVSSYPFTVPPLFPVQLKDLIVVDEFSTVTVQCTAVGYPRPTVVWTHAVPRASVEIGRETNSIGVSHLDCENVYSNGPVVYLRTYTYL